MAPKSTTSSGSPFLQGGSLESPIDALEKRLPQRRSTNSLLDEAIEKTKSIQLNKNMADDGYLIDDGANNLERESVVSDPETEANVVGAVSSFFDEALAPLSEIEQQRLTDNQLKTTRENRLNPAKRLNIPNRSRKQFVKSDGGMMDRADELSVMVASGAGINPSGQGPAYPQTLGPDGLRDGDAADAYAALKDGSFFAAASRIGAVQYDPANEKNRTIDPVMSKAGGLVVENHIANYFQAQKDGEQYVPLETYTDVTKQQKSLLPDVNAKQVLETNKQAVLTQANMNGAIGQEIASLYQTTLRDARIRDITSTKVSEMVGQGVPEAQAIETAKADPMINELRTPVKLTQKESETLGAAYKELWAQSNPDLVISYQDKTTKQNVYQLTQEGEIVLEKGMADRKLLFPSLNVRPNKNPSPLGIKGTGVGSKKKERTGGIFLQKMGSILTSAKANLSTIGHRVDPQRSKLILSTILPVLATGDSTTWQAEINGIGDSKLAEYKATGLLNPYDAGGKPYNPELELSKQMDKVAQVVQSITQERKGLNYFSFFIQGFQGRLAAMQTLFNPTSSKHVRFVTSSGRPAIFKPGSRLDKNYRSMQAMLLISEEKDATTNAVTKEAGENLLPRMREIQLVIDTPMLKKEGDRLRAALQMTDAEYEAVSEAISNGISITNKDFPKFSGLNLDPNNEFDARLIAKIKDRKQDGLIYMEALMDYSKYVDYKTNAKSNPDLNTGFSTYLNAYMDGKTHGTASNSVQLGDLDTAYMTGVVRKTRLTLLDDGDIRDKLISDANQTIPTDWSNTKSEDVPSLIAVAKEVFKNRDLAKLTIMTLGYGKEIESFVDAINETMQLIRVKLGEKIDNNGNPIPSEFNAALDSLVENGVSMEDVSLALLEKYSIALEGILTDQAKMARSTMRGAASLFSTMGYPMVIKSPTGMDLYIGGKQSVSYDDSEKTKITMKDMQGDIKKTTVAHYESFPSSSSSKIRKGHPEVGGHAYSGAIVAPVQGIDAATVALSTSGASYERLSKSSGGVPYVYPIYDSFKVDVFGYDVMLEEVNKNWMKVSMEWSYLKETRKALKKATDQFKQDLSKRADTDVISNNESAYMSYMLQSITTNSPDGAKVGYPVLYNKLNKFLQVRGSDGKVTEESGKRRDDNVNTFVKNMMSVGYNPVNPPEQVTVAHLKMFYRLMSSKLKIEARLDSLIIEAEANKKKLKEVFLKEGYRTESGDRIALQFYTP